MTRSPRGIVPLVLAGLVAHSGCRTMPPPPALPVSDATAIHAVRAAYVAAWLRGDTVSVLSTLDPAAVLLPPGRPAVSGHAAIRAYWWPHDSSRTEITAFGWTLDEVGGRPPFAYARGVSTVSWTYTRGATHQQSSSRSENLTVLRRDRGGEWRILFQKWGPPLP